MSATLLLVLIAGATGGAFVGWFLTGLKKKRSLIRSHVLLNKAEEEKQALTEEIKTLREKNLHAEKELSTLIAEKKHTQALQEQFAHQFKNLSQEILESKSKQFQAHAEKNISTLLTPLKENLQSFQAKVEETYDRESRERFSLKDKIKELCEVHDRLKAETNTLTQALKGDVKAQGQWGEMVLSAILEASGLKEGEHYTTQGQDLKIKDEEGRRQKPDVIIKLPDKKHIVIDAKVSLTHYERFITSSSEEEKQQQLSLFITSLRSHVKLLSEKQYPLAGSLNTPDFVLMFFPIEGAFSLAVQSDPKLFQFSWEKSIVVVSPTTLMATLRTVENIWKREKQTRNAIEIARTGGLLYDKFTLFAKDLEDIGTNLKKAEESYNQSLQKLHTGKGNIVSRIETLKRLGAKTSKEMPKSLLTHKNS